MYDVKNVEKIKKNRTLLAVRQLIRIFAKVIIPKSLCMKFKITLQLQQEVMFTMNWAKRQYGVRNDQG